MKKFLIQASFLVILIFVSLAIGTNKINVGSLFAPERSDQTQVIIGFTNIDVELSDTPAKRKSGLGGRETLASSSGMLFIFEKQDKYSFWMKGVKFPLDFIWIRGKKVVDITRNANPQASGQKDEDLKVYLPNQPIDMVLEVNGGFVDTHNIKIGDMIEIK